MDFGIFGFAEAVAVEFVEVVRAAGDSGSMD